MLASLLKLSRAFDPGTMNHPRGHKTLLKLVIYSIYINKSFDMHFPIKFERSEPRFIK